MRLRLTPRDRSLFELLATLAEAIPTAADQLAQQFAAEPTARAEIAEELRKIEQNASAAKHAVLRRVTETFVTPLDRDDIFTLASQLDACVDAIEEVADRSLHYALATIPPGMVEQVRIIQRCAELTVGAIGRLRSGDNLREFWISISALEDDGDHLHRTLLATIFDQQSVAGSDPFEAMKVKELADDLEAAIDCFERVADTVEIIAVKES